MNGNYEWNKHFTRQRMQQRRLEADLYRQARQQHVVTRGQVKGYLRGMIGKIILLVHQRLAAGGINHEITA